ncbi:MAG: nuclear transport factor 2 family protein [Gammaproteobacteria bacterium]|nr:nuclear transport factor 2 family protein [Gammaproteobacteria bacterium]
MKILSLLMLMTFACTGFLKVSASDSESQVIIGNIYSMWKAIEEDKLDDYMRYIHTDYTLFGESDAYFRKGKDKERMDIADYLQRAKGVRTFMHQPEVVVRGDTAWITYYWSDAGYLSGERFTSRGKSTRIFVKENGHWLCIHSHFTEQP